jgi:hypothetical protein
MYLASRNRGKTWMECVESPDSKRKFEELILVMETKREVE